MPPKVAIVGAGISGLTTAKQCLSDGFQVTVFEAREEIGGQWNYEIPDPVTGNAHSSVYQGVISNSCRDTSCFSDFPIDPSRYPDFYGHKLCLRYVEEYADHFGLKPHIRFNTRVTSSEQLDDGRWQISFTGQDGGGGAQSTFDALFVCTGRNTTPHIPDFEGVEQFQGQVMHSHVYRQPEPFSGKRVAIIGFGSSAVDISSEICGLAAECHLITRRGGWVIPRFVLGKPAEAWDNRFSQVVLPLSVSQWTLTQLYHVIVGELPGELKPEHGMLEANPVIRSDFIENVKVGRIVPHRAGIETITPQGMRLTNGKTLDVDVIIFCTGYRLWYPVIPEKCYKSSHSEFINSPNSVHLYRFTVPPQHPNLFIMGIPELTGPFHPAVELQARWAAAVIAGRINLPSPKEMSEWISKSEKRRVREWVNSDRHTVSVHVLPYCDSLANDIGVAPTFGRLLSRVLTSNPFLAISVLLAVYFGIAASAQYRLFGHDSKPDLAVATLRRLAKGGKELSDEEKAALKIADASPKTNNILNGEGK